MERCYLCKSTEQDEIKYGEFMTRNDISVHYFCLLLTSNLLQRGNDNAGFLGFLVVDVKKEATRIASAVCYYCKQKGANITCCAQKCRRSFHLICGIKNDCENQFVGTFKSFCDRHVSGKKIRKVPTNERCYICYEDLLVEEHKFNSVRMLQAPCCKNGWFHKWCLASFAKSAGYFFKCPLCNDSKTFRQRLVCKGIFIPDRDASWELEPNAFSELLERPGICSADTCTAKNGRTSNSYRNRLIMCLGCGSVAMHRACIEKKTDNFYCSDCQKTFAEVNDTTVVNISHSPDSDEEADVDICGEVDDLSNTVEDIVRPLGRHNARLLLEDDRSSDVNVTDPEDDVVQGPSRRRRANRILSFEDNADDSTDDAENIRVICRRNRRIESSDSGNSADTVVCDVKLRTSRNSDSFFDSGAGSDRSDSSVEKPQLTNSGAGSDRSGNTAEKSQETATTNDKIKESVANGPEKKQRIRKFTSLNSEPQNDWCVAKRTRRQSVHADMKICSEVPEVSKRQSARLSKRSASLTNVASLPYNEIPKKEAKTRKGIEAVQPTDIQTVITEPPVETIKRKRRSRSRTQSYETVTASASASVTQSSSSSHSTNQNPSDANSQINSQSINNCSLNKKQKNNTTRDLNENDCILPSSQPKRRLSRSRSPNAASADIKPSSEEPEISRRRSSRLSTRSSSLTNVSTIIVPFLSVLPKEETKARNEIELLSQVKAIANEISEPLLVENVNKKRKVLSRTHSAESGIVTPTTSITQRRSSLQTTSTTDYNPAHLNLQSLPSKRIRSNSQSSTDCSLNKRPKNKSSTDVNENNYINSDARPRRRSSRSRSPLGSNYSSINAFITPSYIKEKQAQSDVPRQDEDCLRIEVVRPIKIENIFNKNLPNISNRNPHKQNVKCTHEDSSSSSQVKTDPDVREPFPNSYKMFLNSAKSNGRGRRRIFHRFGDRNVPTNQTRIETFFKRL